MSFCITDVYAIRKQSESRYRSSNIIAQVEGKLGDRYHSYCSKNVKTVLGFIS